MARLGTGWNQDCHHLSPFSAPAANHVRPPDFQLGSHGEHLSPFVTTCNSRRGNSAPPFPALGASMSRCGRHKLTRFRWAWTRTNPRRATNWNSSRKLNSPLSSRSAAASSTSGGLPASSRPSSSVGPSGSGHRRCSLLWNGTGRPEGLVSKQAARIRVAGIPLCQDSCPGCAVMIPDGVFCG